MKRFEDNFEAKPSSIPQGGTGLFSKQKFSKGDLLGMMYGVPSSKNGTHVLWIEDHGIKVENCFKYINHSKNPNCMLEGVLIYATKSIAKGEELFFDYDPTIDKVF